MKRSRFYFLGCLVALPAVFSEPSFAAKSVKKCEVMQAGPRGSIGSAPQTYVVVKCEGMSRNKTLRAARGWDREILSVALMAMSVRQLVSVRANFSMNKPIPDQFYLTSKFLD